MADLTEARKQEILKHWEDGTLTNEELTEIGGLGELLNLWAPVPENRGSKHIYSPGEFSLWGD